MSQLISRSIQPFSSNKDKCLVKKQSALVAQKVIPINKISKLSAQGLAPGDWQSSGTKAVPSVDMDGLI
jgi:hypothetical protein